ncbi:MAG: GFA family protein [Hyphomicrobium sp.]|uniref:GFA family protein n=1 Tax=Hyphomicrobium sp. TaxID=82 RepID=UPI003D0E409A
MTREVNVSGGCLCGAVRFKVSGTPIRMAQCHCLDCQRASGTGHMSNAIFNAADVEISGATASYASTSDSGNVLTRHFCPTCGGRVFLTSKARPGKIVMAVGAFDDMSWFEPEIVLFTKRRPHWDITTEDVPNFEAGPPPPKPKA